MDIACHFIFLLRGLLLIEIFNKPSLYIAVFSETTEYSDWEPDGVNLQLPKRRSQRHVKRRRWSSLDANDSSDAEDDEQLHSDDKGRVKVKLESDDDRETGKKLVKKRSTARSKKKVLTGKTKKQVFIFCFVIL